MNNVDIVICSLPPLILDRVPGAPAILKSAVEEAGYTCKTFDLSIEFFINQCNKDPDVYNTLSNVFRPGEIGSDVAEQANEQWIAQSIKKLKSANPQIIGLSVFTNFQHRATVKLARAIRQYMPDVKIIVGGMGLIVNASSLSSEPGIKKIDLLKSFPQYLREKNLVDEIIPYGNDLTDLINTLEKIVGVSEKTKKLNYKEDKVIYNSPIPDYSDYNLNYYLWNQEKSLPVTGSKGCVRSCTFCDIPGQFGKFKYRTGKDIAEEIIELSQKYNINTFEFTDSLVNGSLKAFKEWLTVLANYNDIQPEENKIYWFGQYICRPQRLTPPDIYPLMKRAGVLNLVIGLESGSNYILKSMKKQVTIEDYYDELDQFQKYNIHCQLLMLPGFYNETWDRFLETLQCIVKLQKYLAVGIVTKLGVGMPLYINEKMEIHQMDSIGLVIDPYDEANWRLQDNDSYDFTERARRRLIIQLLMDKLGIPQNWNSVLNMTQILEKLKVHELALTKQLSNHEFH